MCFVIFSNKEFLKMYPGTSASTQFSWNLKLRLRAVDNINKVNTDDELDQVFPLIIFWW